MVPQTTWVTMVGVSVGVLGLYEAQLPPVAFFLLRKGKLRENDCAGSRGASWHHPRMEIFSSRQRRAGRAMVAHKSQIVNSIVLN